jgi:hypothetical protein
MHPTLFVVAQAAPVPPEGIYDIVEPSAETPLWPYLLFIALALAFLAVMVWLILHLLKQRGNSATAPSPAARAARELDRIERERDERSPNHFALAVSEVLKNYFAERYGDPVRFETTEEFLARVAREDTHLPPAVQQELRGFLAASEELKVGHRADAASLALPLSRQARQLLGLSESVNAPSLPRGR